MTGEQSTVDEDLRNAALSGNVSQGVETAQAFLALKTGNYGTMGQLLNDIRTRFPDCTETSALTFCYLLHLNHLADANTAFQDAILRNPISVDAYLLQARVALSQAQQRGPDYRFRLEQAAAFYGMAEAAMPESAEAWTGTALVDSMAGDQKQAVYAIQAAIGGSKSYAASQYVAQYIYHTKSLQEPLSKLRQAAERAKTSDDPADYQDALKALQQATGDALNESAAARDAAKAAASIDPRHLAGISYPSLDTVLKYFIQNGASPIITPPSPGE
jgi:tetratricopeptide (TPR) repeat protein